MSYSFHGRTLPEDLEETLRAYVETGLPTGGFLEAVINNDLKEACGRADERNIWIIPVISAWLYNNSPSLCWGRANSFERWIERKRAERAELEASR